MIPTPLLDRGSTPMRLWRKAAVHAWTAEEIDFRPDREQWAHLPEPLRECVRCVCALFQFGERAVTQHLLPLMHAVAAEQRLEEELFLASFLWDEAKHVDLFDRFYRDVDRGGNAADYSFPAYQRIVGDELSQALGRLFEDASPEAQVRASATYNLVVEGIMAESGCYVFRRVLPDPRVLPGMQRGLRLLARDESRHVAFGVYFVRRLVAAHGNTAYGAFVRRMQELKPLIEASTDAFTRLLHTRGGGAVAISADELVRYSQQRFASRVRRIVDARAPAASARPATAAAAPPR